MPSTLGYILLILLADKIPQLHVEPPQITATPESTHSILSHYFCTLYSHYNPIIIHVPHALWPNVWSGNLQVLEKVWSYMTPNVLTETRCHWTTQNQTKLTCTFNSHIRMKHKFHQLYTSHCMVIQKKTQMSNLSVSEIFKLHLAFNASIRTKHKFCQQFKFLKFFIQLLYFQILRYTLSWQVFYLHNKQI